ncbi:hypothetical protein [Pseudomonas fluorescens]|uniref:hypothetical protein n=1 Tax=Pseudomonas fluorescens TaxID=294 RepID=UPI00259BD71C|nr:hypothetical protein [Pseudomonas fluorescens]WJK07793.1 hypothetical protein QR290_18405 [Pseudomonas fluorescens]
MVDYRTPGTTEIDVQHRAGNHGGHDVFLWFVGKDVLARRKAFLASKVQALVSKPLSAISFAEEDGQKVRFTGVLLEKEGAYTVTVTRDDDKETTVSSRDGLLSLEEVEAYLRVHTPFILSDFRR